MQRHIQRMSQLVNRSQRHYYQYKVFSPQVPLEGEHSLPLYQLDTFQDFSVQSSNLQGEAFGKYFGLLPFQLEACLLGHYKHYILSLELYPESKLLKLTGLSLNGKYDKLISLENLVPVTYSDYRESCKRVLVQPAEFLDWEMIYFNPMMREFYVFDKEGQWHQDNLNHPSLEAAALYDERKWLDSIRML